MSKRKERQQTARRDYGLNRAPHARWLSKHEQTCPQCSRGKRCQLVIVAAARGMLGIAGDRIA